MEFEFATTSQIVFRPGAIHQLGEHAARFGRRAWLVTGGDHIERAGIVGRAMERLVAAGVDAVRLPVATEPDTRLVDGGVRAARAAGCDLVVAVGGGSALDAGKAIAFLAANGGECLDYLEVVGRGKKTERPSLPFIAVPTTAGTGSEVTRNAVIADPASGMKASIRNDYLFPRLALLDPLLTHSLPAEITASTGLDALIQLIEPYVSRRHHPMIDPVAIEGIRRAAPALPRAYATPDDAPAREAMMLAAMWSGMALAHCGLGASHGFAGPLGGSFPIPHGFACAVTLPHVMEANLAAALRAPDGTRTVNRYADVARALGAPEGRSAADTARAGVEIARNLCSLLQVPSLSRFGVTRAAIPDLVANAKRTSSMKANPVDLSDEEMAGILEKAIG
jgi:alcohol dehydrogenase class IV